MNCGASKILAISTLVTSILALCSCGAGRPASQIQSTTSHRPDPFPAGPHVQTNTWFTNAILLKPQEPGSGASRNTPPGTTAPSIVTQLAPLFMVEVPSPRLAGENTSSAPWKLRNLRASSQAKATAGQPRAQVMYQWTITSPTDEKRSREEALRMTLDSDGYPVIWEVLGTGSQSHPVYVAESLEIKARAQYGKPLAGRQHSIEPPLDPASDTKVAGVLQNGPVPMGPIIYINAEGNVATVICRCMPAQARNVVATGTYSASTVSSSLPNFNTSEALETLRLPAQW